MVRICNFPMVGNRHCTQPISDDRPNCGRHKTNLSVQQLGQNPVIYEKGGALHVWAGEPDDFYCLIHNDPNMFDHDLINRTPGQGLLACCLLMPVMHRGRHGELHRDGGPAVIWPDGTREWHQFGELHREDGPAVIKVSGLIKYYQRGQLHREDGPAIIYPNGMQCWYIDGKRHREDGPAIVGPDGSQVWYRHGERIDAAHDVAPDQLIAV